jgi:hypothetical protein
VTVVAVRTSETSNGQVAKKQQAEVAKSAKATLGMKYSAGNTFHFDTTDEETTKIHLTWMNSPLRRQRRSYRSLTR